MLDNDLGEERLSEAFLKQFEANTATYSALMVFTLLGGLLLFVLMAPFELARMRHKVTRLQPNPYPWM